MLSSRIAVKCAMDWPVDGNIFDLSSQRKVVAGLGLDATSERVDTLCLQLYQASHLSHNSLSASSHDSERGLRISVNEPQ